MKAVIVTDLGFGDAGKGTVTDALCRALGADLVVRYNGGAQAGHNVVEEGRHHTFSQFGAGTFLPNVHTYLSRFVVVHPGGLLEEARILASKGVAGALERVTIDPDAGVITPVHQAANRLREVLRGGDRHGSCGLGVGEATSHQLQHPEEAVVARDFASASRLRAKLHRIQQRYWREFSAHRREILRHPLGPPELAVLESGSVTESFLDLVALLSGRVGRLRPTRGTVVLEGAQGVLLDEWRGFHPHTTWSTCTFDNALAIAREWEADVFRLGVIRTYTTRHGAGPFPTEDPASAIPELHNGWGPWQREFRQGPLDLVLLRYAVEVCQGLDGLAVTHLDRLGPASRMAVAYREMERVEPGPFRDLDYQQRLGETLRDVHPIYRPTGNAEALLATVTAVTEAPLVLTSHGPRAKDKRLCPDWLANWRRNGFSLSS